jgi:hypothetical protein
VEGNNGEKSLDKFIILQADGGRGFRGATTHTGDVALEPETKPCICV